MSPHREEAADFITSNFGFEIDDNSVFNICLLIIKSIGEKLDVREGEKLTRRESSEKTEMLTTS